MGDGRAEGSSAIGDGMKAAISLRPDVDGMHICIFGSSQLEGLYAADLLIVSCHLQAVTALLLLF